MHCILHRLIRVQGLWTYVSSIFASIHKHLHRYIASMHRLIYDMHRLMSYLAPWKQFNQDMHRSKKPCIDSFVFEVDSFVFEVDSYTSNRRRFVCITVCIDPKHLASTHILSSAHMDRFIRIMHRLISLFCFY